MTLVLASAVLASVALSLAGPARPQPTMRPTEWYRLPRAVLLVAALVGAVVVMTLFLHGTLVVLGVFGVLVALAGYRLVRRRRAAAAADVRSARVQEYCEAIAAELSAGRPPQWVLARSVADFPEFSAVTTAAELGADVPTALRRMATEPGSGDLRLVAAAWQVAQRSGSGLADALEQVGGTVRERRRAARLVAAELAPAQATARIMAALPCVLGLAGSGLGTHPLAFLAGTPAGLGCLGCGLLLSYAGLVWLQRIADRALGR